MNYLPSMDHENKIIHVKSDTLRKRKFREDLDYKKKEQERNTADHRKKRLMTGYSSKEKELNAQSHAERRKDFEYHNKEQEANTKAHAGHRRDSEYRNKEQEANTKAHAGHRRDSEYRNKEQAANTKAHAGHRSDFEYRNKEQAANTKAHAEERKDKEKLFLSYFNNIKESCTNICSSCGNLWFKRSISDYKISEIIDKKLCSLIFLNNYCKLRSCPDVITLCSTCKAYILKEKIPTLNLSKGLEFKPLPDCLTKLSNLEERFVSPRIPFMNIIQLLHQGQQSLHGNIVNVPVSVDEMISVLPREFQDTQLIQIKFMRKMGFKKVYIHELVRPKVIINAINYLIKQPLYIENNITISNDWLQKSNEIIDKDIDESFNESDNELDTLDISNEEVEDDTNKNLEDDIDLNSETLLDQIDPDDLIIKFAPGEKNCPIGLFYDKDAEELSFPTIFGGFRRPELVGLTYSKIVKSELRSYDRRACKITI